MSIRDEKPDSGQLTPSICEDVLDEYQAANDTLAGLIERNHIDVRDFMILSFVCDQRSMTIASMVKALGLSRESALGCVERLYKSELVSYTITDVSGSIDAEVFPTTTGRAVARRIHAGASLTTGE